MQLKTFRAVAVIFLMSTAVGCVGCAHAPPAATQPSSKAGPPLITIRGEDTRVVFDFETLGREEMHRGLEPDELCCASVGDAVLFCTRDGSYLEFSARDGIALLENNPLSRIRPMGRNTDSEKFIQTYGTLLLIASSVDRLPDALAQYLEDPGPHRVQAIALVRKMLINNGAEFPAEWPGGPFTVLMRLTPSGRDKLNAALQTDDNEAGIYLVSRRRGAR